MPDNTDLDGLDAFAQRAIDGLTDLLAELRNHATAHQRATDLCSKILTDKLDAFSEDDAVDVRNVRDTLDLLSAGNELIAERMRTLSVEINDR